ncbi:hypothetical protein [Bartonella massiliensis]|uniref:hypothetical protein n=1 Tax=Bartonella massiliensis TaxID=929795 RepID=UPI00163CAA0A|nr:hypothetical protein [Bartonella massiliensis]
MAFSVKDCHNTLGLANITTVLACSFIKRKEGAAYWILLFYGSFIIILFAGVVAEWF